MSDATGIPSAEIAQKRRSRLAAFFIRLVKEKPLGTASGIIILIWILIAIFADALTPYPPFEMNLADRLQGSSARHLLGTDHIGRDVLSRLILGARTSILIGLAATALSTVIGTLIGGTSGFLGGKFDIVVQRVVDAWIVFPGLLLLLTIMSIVGRGIPQIILVLGISGGIGGSRLIRSAVIAIKGSDNFLAAEAVGNTKWRSLIRHVLPNVMPVVIITFSITVGGVILSIASLSFLGYGLPPTTPDWGGLLSREGRQYMEQAPWLAVWPGLCLTIAVYCLNMLGDAIRDLLDPRLRGGEGRYGATGKRKRGLLSRLLNPFS
ncbi:MAG: ABC transporter permease [Spirochaetaceae bacterium]|nr:ABC transporter permease [Spirochaetaceae bacterium]